MKTTSKWRGPLKKDNTKKEADPDNEKDLKNVENLKKKMSQKINTTPKMKMTQN